MGLLALAILLRFPLLATIPVGLHYDEAWSGIDAASVSWTHHPIFFTDSNGMEPLYLYLQTISIVLFGHTAFALRVVSAVVGTLTVPALYLLVRRLGGQRLALFAAGILAVTYWHVHVSRLGYRAITLPLCECLAWWALWNGATQRDWRWLAAGGAFVGLALYTYSTARVFPLAVMCWFLWLAIRRRDWRDLLRLVVVGAVALLVFSPLAWYFLQHPAEFIERVGQVVVLSPGVTHSGQPAVLVGAERTLGMFSFHGDPQWKYNLSGKPIFDSLLSIFFYCGIAGCLVMAVRKWRNSASATPEAPERDGPAASVGIGADGAALLLIWFSVMIVPGFVTTDPPETLHTLATAPVVCTFPALGAAWLWHWAGRRRPAWRRFAPAPAVALVLAEAVSTAASYFIIWAPNPQTYYWLHGDVADVAAILERAPSEVTLYVATQYYRHPTMLFLAPQAAQRAIWFESDKSLPVRPATGGALYAFANGYQPLPVAAQALPTADLVAAPRDSNGDVKYRVYRLPQPAALPSLPPPLNVSLGNDVVLLDARVIPPTTTDARLVSVTLRWRVVRQPAQKLSLFVHLLDATGHRWAQSDGQGFFSADWRPGDEVLTTEDIRLPVGMPAIAVRISADFYDVATGALLPWSASSPAMPAPDGGVVVGQFTALPSGVAVNDVIPGTRPAQDVAPGLRLLGAVLPTAPITAGTSFDVTLYFQKTAPQTGPAPGLAILGAPATDAEPIPAASLLAALPVGDVVAVRHVVAVLSRTTATAATVELRLVQGVLPIGSVRLTPLPRVFAAPTPQHALAVSFGSVAELRGYDLSIGAANRQFTITLYWQALAPTDTAYTVFTHLVGPNSVIQAQHDGPPAAGRWPTTAWLPGQVIADRHELTLPAGIALTQDVIQVGLYNGQAPGQPRLTAAGPAGQAGETYAVLAVGR